MTHAVRSRVLLYALLGVTRVQMWERSLCAWGRGLQGAWHIMSERDIVGPVDKHGAIDRLVLIPAGQFDDLLELTRLAAERLPDHDPLYSAIIGAIAQVRLSSMIEP